MKMMMAEDAKWPFCIMICVCLLIFLWGCAVTPQTLKIKGKPETFAYGSIISGSSAAVVSFTALFEDLQNSRVIYVGEAHTSPEAHRVQLEVIQTLFQKFPNLAVGMEMFDHSYQKVLDQ